MGKTRPVIHVDSRSQHQIDTARALSDGFQRHGLNPIITHDPKEQGDFHVCNGPHFAKDHWPECLYIDRAYWGDPLAVSVHWLSEGEKIRTKGNPYREHPVLEPIKTGDRRVYLCDWKGVPEGQYHTVRYHPSEKPSRYTLGECLNNHDVALGRRTTALVTAHIKGLRVETNDPHSPVFGITDREQWARDLAWHNWSKDEIARGDMWAFLSQ